jgi:hypothetical protein
MLHDEWRVNNKFNFNRAGRGTTIIPSSAYPAGMG